MMNARLFFFLLLFTVLFSCKKNKELTITIEGTVRNNYTMTPASGVVVRIRYQEIGNGTFSNAYKTAATVTTDNNGNYSVSFPRPSAAGYKVELSSDLHFATESLESADNFSSSETNHRDYSITAKSWFSVRLHNTSPVSASDQIIYQNSGESLNCSSCCNSSARIFTGYSMDTTLVCLRAGGSMLRFDWSVLKLGSPNAYSDSVTTTPFDTTYYSIDY